MKSNFTLIVLLIIFSVSTSYSQESCKVLMPEISGSYTGNCKKGLAHGKGEAKGVDVYLGNFKKGYPNGKGVYTWGAGHTYNGYWKMGVKHGEGKYIIKNADKDTILIGIWEENKYMGPIPEKPKIIQKINVERHTSFRQGDGNNVRIYIYRSGTPNSDIEDLIYLNSSGTKEDVGGTILFADVEFPFTAKINYRSWNKMQTARVSVAFEFVISQPGDWKVTIHN